MESGSTEFVVIECVDAVTPRSSRGDDAPWQLISCTVLANGEVIPAWQKDSGSITLFAFVGEPGLYLVPDPTAYGGRWGNEKKAKLFIEPTN